MMMNTEDIFKEDIAGSSWQSSLTVALHQEPVCSYVELPRLSYQKAWSLQKKIVSAKIKDKMHTDVVLLLEHEPVFTIGRNGDEKNLKVSEGFLKGMDISVIRIERGGDITYHGPGQLVVYPIVNLRDAGLGVKQFVFKLEEIMIRTAADWGVSAERNVKNPGVWIKDKKLGSIGITVRRGISFHGFAFNVNLLIEPFNWINPCGLKDVTMTSMRQELGCELSMDRVRKTVRNHFSSVFGVEPVRDDLSCLKDLI